MSRSAVNKLLTSTQSISYDKVVRDWEFGRQAFGQSARSASGLSSGWGEGWLHFKCEDLQTCCFAPAIRRWQRLTSPPLSTPLLLLRKTRLGRGRGPPQ